ncbi:CehA/McbA family metallohydrolase [Congregibacter variabilis]|uniref:CehA/McbA family metallohydrolase n=1 Tax=Congregibacter variabilis TaxID=3081200 RepID=A0ABZ0I7J0_9GAMM|nr:CehA/McbA family metallohydrolase [Congregibacter sp. IMCC43200]
MNLTRLTACAALLTIAFPGYAQWEHRYPKVDTYGHHTYLEQEDLPIVSSGPIDPAPSPDGQSLAFAHQGWIWLMDLETGKATRLTSGADVDGRPRWSPSADRIVFVRDTGLDTQIVIKALPDGSEILINSPAIDLDPEFTQDGDSIYYTSAKSGTPDIWKRHIATGVEERLTDNRRMTRGARSVSSGGFIYMGQSGPSRTIRYRNPLEGTDVLLNEQGWHPHITPDAHPNGQAVVFGIGDGNSNRIAVMDRDRPDLYRWLTGPGMRALTPAFSADGSTVYFSRSDGAQQFHLMSVPTAGGAISDIEVTSFDHGTPLGKVSLTVSGVDGPLPARVSILRADGHPVVSPDGPTYSDIQNGGAFFYTDGRLSLDLPPAKYTVKAVNGPFSTPTEASFTVRAGQTAKVALALEFVWDSKAAGYVSADHHIHLNASGVHDLAISDLLPLMAGEQLDHVAPMAWNQYNRFVDTDRLGNRVRGEGSAEAVLSQEVRSGFHGHVGLIGADKAFAPWFFEPGSPLFDTRDHSNGDAVAFAQANGFLPTYVHPVAGHEDPFDDLTANAPPYELILDGVLSEGVGIELVCMWTSPLGTAETWYRFLNIGQPMPATSGTDMMANFYRTPAMGTARAYLPAAGGAATFDEAVQTTLAGKGFLTTGPALLFSVDGTKPGGAVKSGKQRWSLELASVKPVEKVDIIVNGEVVATFEGISAGETKVYSGESVLPSGGWIAARAHGGPDGWPSMSPTHFAHSAPIWINEIGSTEPEAAKSAARDLMDLLDFSQSRFISAYKRGDTPKLDARFAKARKVLTGLIGN